MTIRFSNRHYIPTAKRTSKDRGHRFVGKWISKKNRWAMYALDGYRCRCCLKSVTELSGDEVMSLDHLACWIHWGSNDFCNLLTLCRSCNSSRGDLKINDWLKSLDPATSARLTAEIKIRVKLNRSTVKRQITAMSFWLNNGQDFNCLPPAVTQ